MSSATGDQIRDSESLEVSTPASKSGDPNVSFLDKQPNLPNVTVVEVHRYYPPGVLEIIARGGGAFIGALNESSVLKYPCYPGTIEDIQTEAQILSVLGSHPRIIASKGLTKEGLILQRLSNGCLADYITSNPDISLHRKLLWCKQAAEAVSFIHSKHVIHCDINLRNLLLDESFDIILADFQGMLKNAEGDVLLDGFSRECTKSYLPRHGDYASVKTDLFALGSAIFYIITGHEVFPELNSRDHEEEISSRFKNSQFPLDEHPCFVITGKCWRQEYHSADEIITELSLVQDSLLVT